MLTTREVAHRFKVTEATVRRWLKLGAMRGTFLSNRAGYRIPESEVTRVFQNGIGQLN